MIKIKNINGELEIIPLTLNNQIVFKINNSRIVLSSQEFDVVFDELKKIKENKESVITETEQ